MYVPRMRTGRGVCRGELPWIAQSASREWWISLCLLLPCRLCLNGEDGQAVSDLTSRPCFFWVWPIGLSVPVLGHQPTADFKARTGKERRGCGLRIFGLLPSPSSMCRVLLSSRAETPVRGKKDPFKFFSFFFSSVWCVFFLQECGGDGARGVSLELRRLRCAFLSQCIRRFLSSLHRTAKRSKVSSCKSPNLSVCLSAQKKRRLYLHGCMWVPTYASFIYTQIQRYTACGGHASRGAWDVAVVSLERRLFHFCSSGAGWGCVRIYLSASLDT